MIVDDTIWQQIQQNQNSDEGKKLIGELYLGQAY